MIKPEHTDLESKCVSRSRDPSTDNYDSKRLTICIYKVAQADWQIKTKTQNKKKKKKKEPIALHKRKNLDGQQTLEKCYALLLEEEQSWWHLIFHYGR